MANIAVIGDRDSVYGFSALGLDVFYAREDDEIRQCFQKLVNGDYGVIYITEAAASVIPEEIDKCREQALPAVILIPGIWGNTGDGINSVKKSVEQAVGSDILFRE